MNLFAITQHHTILHTAAANAQEGPTTQQCWAHLSPRRLSTDTVVVTPEPLYTLTCARLSSDGSAGAPRSPGDAQQGGRSAQAQTRVRGPTASLRLGWAPTSSRRQVDAGHHCLWVKHNKQGTEQDKGQSTPQLSSCRAHPRRRSMTTPRSHQVG
jgi:hypothetical protein